MFIGCVAVDRCSILKKIAFWWQIVKMTDKLFFLSVNYLKGGNNVLTLLMIIC